MKEKTPLLDELVCFQLEVFYYFSEKLPLSQKLCYFRGRVASHKVVYYQQLSNARLPSQFLS